MPFDYRLDNLTLYGGDMKRALPTKEDLSGRRFGKLEVIGRSDKRAPRGSRTVPLWECRCDCGRITYKATDTLTNPDLNMCNDCVGQYAASKMRDRAGYVNGTQLSRITNAKAASDNVSGVRGVYYDRRNGKWRARLRFQGKFYNLGTYERMDDAVEARRKAEEEIWGTFLEQIQ